MEHIKKFFEGDVFAKHCGIEILEVGPGTARAKMEVKPHHMNGAGVVQGGAIFTLADLTFGLASNWHGNVALAINVSINFITSTREGTLYAHAKEVNFNHKLSNCQVDITNEKGVLIATFQGLAYRKKDVIPT